MLKLSRSTKVGLMLFLSATMFFVELVVGIVAGSITLIADSFHMLNDVLGMVIALWAIKVAKSEKTVPSNTYGWQRAEILGALTNGVLLLGLCLTIYIDAIERFIKIEEVNNPKLVMIVGCIGLTFNLMGLLLFHEHGHAHGHSHGHSHAHSHAADEESIVGEEEGLIGSSGMGAGQTAAYAAIETPQVGLSPGPIHSSAADNRSIIGVPHPVYTQQAIIISARQMQDGSTSDDSATGSAAASGQSSPRIVSQGGSIPAAAVAGSGAPHSGAHRHAHGGSACSHQHQHKKRKAAKSGANKKDGDGSGGHLNMRGVWLHIFGDCITNIAVIISGLVIWKAEGSWRFYFDPAISLLINTLIVCITIPLVKSASFILLNGVPSGVDLDNLRRDLKAIPNVTSIHDLHVWQLSDTKNVASVHVLIDRPSFHQCIHNSNSSSAVNLSSGRLHEARDHDHGHDNHEQLAAKSTKSARLISRNQRSATIVSSATVDMDCLYMDVAAEVKRVMHSYGIHSTTIQPEFVVGQSVSVATIRAPASAVAVTDDVPDQGDVSEREGSIFSRVAIVPDSLDSRHGINSATIGPCLLSCRDNGCLPSSCCPGESPIKVVPGSSSNSSSPEQQ
ncbi:Zinc resistance conferring protein [Coemansia aciculifera]|uniref:Zinc resistance conferring protein n=1 Tax=Coemansia aciculifera TaxID=417176 RepID=A0A9W8M311_9FUNG|nr:Zinc resistance conferring protein [Coemansia aciculifera]